MDDNDIGFANTTSPSIIDCDIKLVADIDRASLCADQRHLLAYFESKTGGTRLASRADLNPSDITRMLPMIALHELVYDDKGRLGDFRVRLLGTRMVFYYGERTGETYFSLRKTPELIPSADRIFQSLATVAKEKQPALCSSSFQDGRKKWLNAVSMYIPLSTEGENVNMAISYADITEEPAQR